MRSNGRENGRPSFSAICWAILRGITGICLEENGATDLSVDERGQFYHHGVLIPFKVLLDASAVPAKPNPRVIPATTNVQIDIPMGLTQDSVSLKSRLAVLRAKLEENGWDITFY